MVVTDLTLSVVPGVLALVAVCVLVYLLALCVCGDKPSNNDAELTAVSTKHNSVVIPPEALNQAGVQTGGGGTTSRHLEVETAVTPLDTSATQNGRVHSRGNSVDLNKTDRYSAASSGSSPRPVTINRELPDIPVDCKSQTLPHDRAHSAQLPEKPSTLRGLPSSLESPHAKRQPSHSQFGDGTGNRNHTSIIEPSRAHTHLPEIPPEYRNRSPIGARAKSLGLDKPATVIATNPTSKSPDADDTDVYDHLLDEKTHKKVRPRSDYDHVVITGSENMIVHAKKTDVKENDYELAEDAVGDTDVMANDVMVVPASPAITKITVTHKTTPKKADQYSKVKGDGLVKIPDSDDPYNMIRGDDPYNKIRDMPYNHDNRIKDSTPYNRVKDDDPYNVVKGDADSDDLDPYNTVKDDKETRVVKPKKKLISDPYSLVDDERDVSNQSHITDPYARVGDDLSEIYDPYNRVIEENDVSINSNAGLRASPSDDYATVNKTDQVEYAKVNKFSIRNKTRNRDANADPLPGNTHNPGQEMNPHSPTQEIIEDEYATVSKIRDITHPQSPSLENSNASSSGANFDGTGGSFGALSGPLQTPPEPPRGYSAYDNSGDADHYNTVMSLQTDGGAQGGATDTRQGLPAKKKEPPYTKLSARESLASMNARIASNTYETVPERDNVYSTVDGGVGEGDMQPKVADGRESIVSQYYSEIPELTDGASAPAPPSLDSLHETAKQHQDEFKRKADFDPYSNIPDTIPGQQRTPTGQGHQRTNSGPGHFRTPSSDRDMVPMATAEVVDLDQNYSSVEGHSSDLTEFDPNYETVEEAKSKVKYEVINGASNSENPKVRMHVYEDPDSATKRKYEVINGSTNIQKNATRGHVYEEVSIGDEDRQSSKRAVNLHTYEDVTEVRSQREGRAAKSDKKPRKSDKCDGEASGSSSGQKAKPGHQRSSSGDQSRFGKRKFSETKDKGKESKKKSEGKDKDSNKKGGSSKWL